MLHLWHADSLVSVCPCRQLCRQPAGSEPDLPGQLVSRLALPTVPFSQPAHVVLTAWRSLTHACSGQQDAPMLCTHCLAQPQAQARHALWPSSGRPKAWLPIHSPLPPAPPCCACRTPPTHCGSGITTRVVPPLCPPIQSPSSGGRPLTRASVLGPGSRPLRARRLPARRADGPKHAWRVPRRGRQQALLAAAVPRVRTQTHSPTHRCHCSTKHTCASAHTDCS